MMRFKSSMIPFDHKDQKISQQLNLLSEADLWHLSYILFLLAATVN